MVVKKMSDIIIDKETAVFILTYIQRKADKQAGLKIQNQKLKKEIQTANERILQVERDNRILAQKLTAINHEYQKLNELYNKDTGGDNEYDRI